MCQQAVLAHTAPIGTLGHGPFDNGPLIVLDESDVFSICDVGPRLSCSQSVDLGRADGATAALAMVPQLGLYVVCSDGWLCVRRRLACTKSG